FYLSFVSLLFYFLFFFQAEDGIRDFHVTGVQTCALPISDHQRRVRSSSRPAPAWSQTACARGRPRRPAGLGRRTRTRADTAPGQIGRASCRERVSISVLEVSLKKKQN